MSEPKKETGKSKSPSDIFKEKLAENCANYAIPIVLIIVVAFIFIVILGYKITTTEITIGGIKLGLSQPTETPLPPTKSEPLASSTMLPNENQPSSQLSTPTITEAVAFSTSLPTEDQSVTTNSNVVVDYFDAINQGDYLTAWKKLHGGVQAYSGSYEEYENYWETEIKEVIINELEVISMDSDAGQGEITASIFYEHFTYEASNEYRFCLIFDRQNGEWLIYSQRLIKNSCDYDE